MPTVDAICRSLDAFAPPRLAAEWDNTGLLLGDGHVEVRNLLTCLTLTADVAEEAISSNAQLVVSHHPILFKGTKNLSTRGRDGKLLWRLARAGVAVYSPHTCFDNAAFGINQWIGEKLGLKNLRPLRPLRESDEAKIVVFTPEADLERVSKAMAQAGAGIIGEYRECSFRTSGTGTFRGSDASNPKVGTKGVLETVTETRLEMICPKSKLETVVRAMRQAHSYEEPAYDIYPLEMVRTHIGEGRIGEFDDPKMFADIIIDIKPILGIELTDYVGTVAADITRVAIACGAAGEFLSDAIRARADLFITGEMRFHELLHARNEGMTVLLPGHYASERPAVEWLAGWLGGQFPGLNSFASRVENDPLRTI